MRRLICFLIALPLLLPAQEIEPSFHAMSSEVLLDVVVRDKKAHIVRDLKPDEIQVFEDGVPQKLRRFEFFDGRAAPQPSASPATAPASAGLATPASAAAHPLNMQELRDISVVSVVIGDLDQRGRKFTLDTMHDFIKNELRSSTYVGVYTLDEFTGLHKLQPYTNNQESISAAMDQAVRIAFHERPKLTAQDSRDFGSGTSLQAPSDADQPLTQTNSSALGPAQLINQITEANDVTDMEDVYQGSMRYLSSLRTLIQSQSAIPGRKVILLFAAGLPVHFDSVEPLQNVVSTANRSNVTIYAVDTRSDDPGAELQNSQMMLARINSSTMRRQMGIVNGGDQTVRPMEVAAPEWVKGAIHADPHGNLAVLAESTGGALLPDSTDLRGPLRRAMEEVEMHYELSYSPTNSAADGTFRKIEVKVSRPGVNVFARSGYYAVPLLNGHQIYPFEMAALKAINTRPQLQQFEFHDAAFQFRPGSGRDQLAFVFEAQARDLAITKDKNWAQVHVSVTTLIKNDQGQIVDKISKDIPYEVPLAQAAELQRGVVTFTTPFLLPPGRYTMETAAIDRESMKASVRRSSLVVEQSTGLAMSDVAVIRRVDTIQGVPSNLDPLETEKAKVTPELLDVIPPEVNGQVRFYAVAYPPAPINAPVEVSMEIWRNGQLIMRTPASEVPLDPTGAASILAGVPMEKLSSGQYEAQISFQYKGQKVSKVTTFAVGAGG